MLQQGGVPQLQSACRVTDGANGARVGLPGNQVCSHDLLWLDPGATGLRAVDWRKHQRNKRQPKFAKGNQTDEGGNRRRKRAFNRSGPADTGMAASPEATINLR